MVQSMWIILFCVVSLCSSCSSWLQVPHPARNLLHGGSGGTGGQPVAHFKPSHLLGDQQQQRRKNGRTVSDMQLVFYRAIYSTMFGSTLTRPHAAIFITLEVWLKTTKYKCVFMMCLWCWRGFALRYLFIRMHSKHFLPDLSEARVQSEMQTHV